MSKRRYGLTVSKRKAKQGEDPQIRWQKQVIREDLEELKAEDSVRFLQKR